MEYKNPKNLNNTSSYPCTRKKFTTLFEKISLEKITTLFCLKIS